MGQVWNVDAFGLKGLYPFSIEYALRSSFGPLTISIRSAVQLLEQDQRNSLPTRTRPGLPVGNRKFDDAAVRQIKT